MKLKNLILTGLSLVLVSAIAISGTVAYLQHTDSDVNVMTYGNVEITQNEYEWNAAGDALVDFTQNKPLYPYTGNLGWTNETEDGGAYRKFTMNNVIDKYVTVTNTGRSSAYVRTLLAFEMGSMTIAEWDTYVGLSLNAANSSSFPFPGAWKWDKLGLDVPVVTINGENYALLVATHQDPIEAGEETIPSLLQVYMSNAANNEHFEKLDGNNNDTVDIFVLSQAVQSAGFKDAETALNAAFGDAEANATEWFEAIEIPDGSILVTTFEELYGITTISGHAKLGDSITTDSFVYLDGGIINGNGFELSSSIHEKGVVDVTGGTIKNLDIYGIKETKQIGRVTVTTVPDTCVITEDEGMLTSDLILENVITSNTRFAISVNANNNSVYVKDCELANNVDIIKQKEAIFEDCYFITDGEANDTGAAYISLGGNMTFINCHFGDNIDFYANLTDSYISGTVEFINCTFGANKVPVGNTIAFFQNNMEYSLDRYDGAFGNGEFGRTNFTFIVDGTVVWEASK